MQSKAVLRTARISPQKARLVADMIRGKYASEAEEMLRFTQTSRVTTMCSACPKLPLAVPRLLSK